MAGFTITPDGHGFIVAGELDMAYAGEFAAAFVEVLHLGGPVTVDMRPLRFMDSTGIKETISAARAAPEACIILHGVHDSVERVVELTGIAKLPNLHVIPCSVGVAS